MQPDRVLWILPMVSLIPDESLARLKQRFGAKFHNFTSIEVQALVTADIEGRVDNARMREITPEHTTDITKLLQKLVSKKALIQDGQGRWTRYRLPSKPHSVYIENDSVHIGGNSVHIEDNSVHKIDISDDEWNRLIEIATSARENKHLPPKKMEAIILQLCQRHWLTRRQLAELLNRNYDGLRSRFLSPMLARGCLRLYYPEKPNRADQAYIKNIDEADLSH